jgi:hypothetical protein
MVYIMPEVAVEVPEAVLLVELVAAEMVFIHLKVENLEDQTLVAVAVVLVLILVQELVALVVLV